MVYGWHQQLSQGEPRLGAHGLLDPETLTPVKDGETGVIAHYDLANWNSCIGILTEDLGHRTPDGFLLQGRAKGAEARGCSIAVDEVISANR